MELSLYNIVLIIASAVLIGASFLVPVPGRQKDRGSAAVVGLSMTFAPWMFSCCIVSIMFSRFDQYDIFTPAFIVLMVASFIAMTILSVRMSMQNE